MTPTAQASQLETSSSSSTPCAQATRFIAFIYRWNCVLMYIDGHAVAQCWCGACFCWLTASAAVVDLDLSPTRNSLKVCTKHAASIFRSVCAMQDIFCSFYTFCAAPSEWACWLCFKHCCRDCCSYSHATVPLTASIPRLLDLFAPSPLCAICENLYQTLSQNLILWDVSFNKGIGQSSSCVSGRRLVAYKSAWLPFRPVGLGFPRGQQLLRG